MSVELSPTSQEVDIGLASDVGTLAYLPKVTGNQSLLRELAYTGRSFDAQEAKNLGLVSKVVEGQSANFLPP
jgi:Delta3,5-Delta2,4-dienoyl-CoA isomerase